MPKARPVHIKNPLLPLGGAWFVAIAAVVTLAIRIIVEQWWVCAVVGVAIGAGVVWWRHASAPARLAHAIGGTAVTESARPRLFNIVEGLSLTLGVTEPELREIDAQTINAGIAGNAHSGVLFVTSGAMDRLGVVQLEALIAHQLVRLRRGDGDVVATLHSFLVSIGLGRFASRFISDQADIAADLEAVGATRYPPGLLGVFDAMSSTGCETGREIPGLDLVWLAPPGATSKPVDEHFSPISTRMAVLREL